MRFIAMAALIFCLSGIALADTPPLPARKSDSLEAIQSQLEREQKQQSRLETKIKTLGNDLDATRAELVTLADDIQANERVLTALENRIAQNTKEAEMLTDKLEQDYSAIADLVLALQRMRRIPPESLIVRPGAPLQTAQSAMLLQSALPAVDRRATQLSAALQKLAGVMKALEDDKLTALTQKRGLETKQAAMKSLLQKRENLYRSTQSDYEQRKQNVARLSREAKTLMDLITSLEQENARNRVQQTAAATQTLPHTGDSRLPVAGYILTAFNAIDEIGARSQGIKIEARPDSLVVSPMGGIVRFAGTFKNYGRMVIIEHKGGYHSLIAGFARTDTTEGSRVKAGEPLGQLPVASSRGGRPVLYYELRLHGKPIDPARKLSNVQS